MTAIARDQPRTRLQVAETSAADDPRWDRFVDAHPDGTGFLQSGWLRSLQAEVGTPQRHLACEDGQGRVVGVLPLVATRGVPGGGPLSARRWSSLPRTPVGGPLASRPDAVEPLLSAAVALAEADGRLLQIKRPSADLDDAVMGPGRRPWRTGFVLDLPPEPDLIRFGSGRNHRRIRTAVHRAERAGLRIRSGGVDDVPEWYQLYLENMRHHRVPARRRRFFESLLGGGPPAELLLVECAPPRGGIVAGGVFVVGARTVFHAFTAVDRELLLERPNELLQWHAIHRACERGYRRYDLGEVPSGDDGLRCFKAKWGTSEVELWHYYWPPGDRRSTDHVGSGRMGTAARAAWGRVPLPVTALVGAGLNSRL